MNARTFGKKGSPAGGGESVAASGLAGAHRLYLGRYATGAIQAVLFIGCIAAVFGFQLYPAFAGLVISWLWMLVDGLKLKQLHAEAVGTPRDAVVLTA